MTVFLQRNNSKGFLDSSALRKASEQHLSKMVQQFGIGDALALGLWIDGTPTILIGAKHWNACA